MSVEQPTLQRIALGIEYEGTRYYGWQRQLDKPSIQQHLEEALSKVAHMPILVAGSGRTDTGVHAVGQVIHFDTPISRDVEAWTRGVNSYLPEDIRVRWMRHVDSSFCARRSAIARHYRYYIYSNPVSPGILRNGVSWVYGDLDIEAMQQAAKCFIGEHDFSSFRAAQCQAKTPHRNITHFEVKRSGLCIVLNIVGNAFLHHMVRNFAGVLIAIGKGKQPVSWAKEVLDAKDRRAAGITAPASGLYLVHIEYPKHFGIPDRVELPWCLEVA